MEAPALPAATLTPATWGTRQRDRTEADGMCRDRRRRTGSGSHGEVGLVDQPSMWRSAGCETSTRRQAAQRASPLICPRQRAYSDQVSPQA